MPTPKIIPSSTANVIEFPYSVLQLKRLAGKGNPEMQYRLGLRHLEGRGVQRSGKMAYAWFSNAAQQQYQPAYLQLAALCAYGKNIYHDMETDIEESLLWFYKAREAGYPEASYNLALILLTAQDVTLDETKGFQLLQESARLGHREAIRLLADAYRNGMFGIPIDADQAKLWDLCREGKTKPLPEL